MVPSLFHRHAHTSSEASHPPIPQRPSMALSGLNVFSSSSNSNAGPRLSDGLAFVPYTAPIRPREAAAMGDLSYELAHPSKFSDWTDDGDEHALPPPSLGIALLSKARAAIKASREAVSAKPSDDSDKISGLPTSRSRAPTMATSRSRAPTMAPVAQAKADSPIHKWLDLGISLSPPCSPNSNSEFRKSTKVVDELRISNSRMTAFQFLENANQLSSPSRIRRQTDIAGSAGSYAQMLEANEGVQTQVVGQASFINRYPDFEVNSHPSLQAGPSTLAPLGEAFQHDSSPRSKSRRTTTSSVLRTWDQAENTPASMESSLQKSGTQKSSSSRKGRESLFSSFRKKERSRNGKSRAEDVDLPESAGRSGQNQDSAAIRSLPPVRGLRNMFSMEPIVRIDNRPMVDGIPPDKPLPPPPTEFGVMIRAPTEDGLSKPSPIYVPGPGVVSLNSPPPRFDTSPLLGELTSYKASPLMITAQVTGRVRQLTDEVTLVDAIPPPAESTPVRELASPMASPSRSPPASLNVSPFSTAFEIMSDSPMPDVGVSFLYMKPRTPSSTTRSHTPLPEPSPARTNQEMSPARDDISLVDPDLYQAFEAMPNTAIASAGVELQDLSMNLSRSPSPETEETETDRNASPRTKRVRSLTDMRDAFRRMQAFTGLEVSECDSRRTSTTVGGDMSDEDISGRVKHLDDDVDADEDHLDIHDVVAAHIHSVNLVLASPITVVPETQITPMPPNPEREPAMDSSETMISIQSSAMVTAPSRQSTSMDDRSLPSAGDLAGEMSRAPSGRSFYTALDDHSALPRSLSKSSSLGALSTRNTADSLLEHVEKREGSGWWSDSSKTNIEKTKSDELVDKRLAALEDKVKSSPSPFKSLRSSNNTPLGQPDSDSRRSILGHTHTPRLSLVGDSTWSQGEDGSPIRLTESPRRLRPKKRPARGQGGGIDSPSRHVRDTSATSGSTLGEGLPSGLTALKSPFARKVSPDIARRAGLITTNNRHSSSSQPSPSRRRGLPRKPEAGPSTRQVDDDAEVQSSQGSQSGSEMSSLCKLEMELGTSVRRRGKEIDTLISTLTQTRREVSTLRSQVVHKHAIMGDMLEERQEMKDEIRLLRQQLAKVERESVVSPVRAFGSVRSDRTPFRGTPESRRRSSLAREILDRDQDRTPGYGHGEVESFLDHYHPETPTRRSITSNRSPVRRHMPPARSEVSVGTSAGLSIRSSPSRRD